MLSPPWLLTETKLSPPFLLMNRGGTAPPAITTLGSLGWTRIAKSYQHWLPQRLGLDRRFQVCPPSVVLKIPSSAPEVLGGAAAAYSVCAAGSLGSNASARRPTAIPLGNSAGGVPLTAVQVSPS